MDIKSTPVSLSDKHLRCKVLGLQGNEVSAEEAKEVKGSVSFEKGSGNRVVIGAGTKFSGTITFIGSNNLVRIGTDCHFRGKILIKNDGQTVDFGDHSTTVDVYILCQEQCNVTIGRWCMFSRNIEIRTTDAHAVIDRASGNRLNFASSIIIGDHVWVGVGAIINKGAVIPSDSIVGAMSFVNRKFEESGVVLAGAPAKVVKRNITWSSSRKHKFTQEEMDAWRQ